MILPYFGVISEIMPVFSRKPIFGYTGLVLAAFAIAGLSMGVWAHHMFTTGAVNDPFFSFVSFLIAVPTGVKFFNWIGTMWRGSISFDDADALRDRLHVEFLLGGVTGVMVASPPIDFQARDSYFLVAHFHYMLGGGSLFAMFAAVYFWCPEDVRLHAATSGSGSGASGCSSSASTSRSCRMHFIGLDGMPRRIFTYPERGRAARAQPDCDGRLVRDARWAC